MKPQNNDFNSHIYILYCQSNMLIILYQIRLLFFIFEIKYCQTEVLEQHGEGTEPPRLTSGRHATLLADTDVTPHYGSAPIT